MDKNPGQSLGQRIIMVATIALIIITIRTYFRRTFQNFTSNRSGESNEQKDAEQKSTEQDENPARDLDKPKVDTSEINTSKLEPVCKNVPRKLGNTSIEDESDDNDPDDKTPAVFLPYYRASVPPSKGKPIIEKDKDKSNLNCDDLDLTIVDSLPTALDNRNKHALKKSPTSRFKPVKLNHSDALKSVQKQDSRELIRRIKLKIPQEADSCNLDSDVETPKEDKNRSDEKDEGKTSNQDNSLPE